MGDGELLIGIGGLLLAGLTYFAGVQRGKRTTLQQQKDSEELQRRQHDHDREMERERQYRASIDKAVDRYVYLYRSGHSSGVYALADSGLELIGSDAGIREAIDQIQKIIREDPWGAVRNRVGEADLLAFFQFVSAERVNFNLQSVESVLDTMRSQGLCKDRPA